MADPEFLADAQRQDLGVRPVSAVKADALIREIYASPPAVVKLAIDVMNEGSRDLLNQVGTRLQIGWTASGRPECASKRLASGMLRALDAPSNYSRNRRRIWGETRE